MRKPGQQRRIIYFSIALSILEQIKNEISGLNRPASLTIRLAVLRLSSTTNTTAKAAEGNGLLVSQNIFQVTFGLSQLHFPDGMGCLSRVLKQIDKSKL